MHLIYLLSPTDPAPTDRSTASNRSINIINCCFCVCRFGWVKMKTLNALMKTLIKSVCTYPHLNNRNGLPFSMTPHFQVWPFRAAINTWWHIHTLIFLFFFYIEVVNGCLLDPSLMCILYFWDKYVKNEIPSVNTIVFPYWLQTT